jgi:hypothetical protein
LKIEHKRQQKVPQKKKKGFEHQNQKGERGGEFKENAITTRRI